MLIPFHAPIPPAAVVTYIGSDSSTNNNTTYTFTGESIGTASSDRVVVLGVVCEGGSVGITSVTIGGNAMTQAGSTANQNNQYAALFYLAYPTGTTADIVVTWGDGKQRCAITVYAVTNLLSATPTDTGVGTAAGGTSANTTIDYTADGIVIAAGCVNDATALSWTNLSENSDFAVESATQVGSASKAVTSSTTGETITFTSVATVNLAFAVASWR